jgi:hypothetical protein
MRSLLVHVFLEAVRDAERPPQPEVKTEILQWADSQRFEFWVEWLDIPVEVAEATLSGIAQGNVDVSTILRTETGRRRAPNEPRHRKELYERKS